MISNNITTPPIGLCPSCPTHFAQTHEDLQPWDCPAHVHHQVPPNAGVGEHKVMDLRPVLVLEINIYIYLYNTYDYGEYCNKYLQNIVQVQQATTTQQHMFETQSVCVRNWDCSKVI